MFVRIRSRGQGALGFSVSPDLPSFIPRREDPTARSYVVPVVPRSMSLSREGDVIRSVSQDLPNPELLLLGIPGEF